MNQYFNIEYTNSFFISNFQNNIISGLTFRLESNHGKGRIFDVLKPHSITSAFRDRPRSYDNVPGLLISSLYMEDKIKGKLWKKFQLSLGFRLESYGRNNGIFTSHQGNFFNPRINFLVYTSENSQLRIGYGTTSKAPPLSMLYPNPLYYDVADVNRYSTVDSLRLAVVSTHIYDKENKDLKGSRQIKKEISFHQKIGNIGLAYWIYK